MTRSTTRLFVLLLIPVLLGVACAKKNRVRLRRRVKPRVTDGSTPGGLNGSDASPAEAEPRRIFEAKVLLTPELVASLQAEHGYSAPLNCVQQVREDEDSVLEFSNAACPSENALVPWPNVVQAFKYRQSENGAGWDLYHPDYSLPLGHFSEGSSPAEVDQVCTGYFNLNQNDSGGCAFDSREGKLQSVSVYGN